MLPRLDRNVPLTDRRPSPADRLVLVRFGTCLVRGHQWDFAPRHRRGDRMVCVRCGLETEPVRGLGL